MEQPTSTESKEASMPLAFKKIAVIKDGLREDIETAHAIISKLFGGPPDKKDSGEGSPEAISFFSKLKDELNDVNSLVIKLKFLLENINENL